MILITGGLGFLGSNLAENLVKDNHQVVLVTRSDKKLGNISNIVNDVIVEYGDVTDDKWLTKVILTYKPSIIFHFAGQLTSYESFDYPLYDVDVNCKSTLTILEAMRWLPDPCRLVLGSTFWVIGKPDTLPINENTPCNPQNIYAANRLASENYCKIYNRVYGLDAVTIRLTNTFGIREQHDSKKKAALNYLLYRGLKGEVVTIYSDGNFFRDYIYVSDVVTAARSVMDNGKAGECYFVGTGVKTWFYDIGEWIKELTGCKIEYIEPPDYHKRIDVGSIVIDNQKLKNLGWDWEVTVKDGLKLTLESYEVL